jgi:dual specificity MAP kinase phosphatase
LENPTQYPSSPGDEHRINLIHINSLLCPQSTTIFPQSSLQTSTPTKNMLCRQQTPTIANNKNDHSSIFLTCSQLTAYMTSTIQILIIDCGSPLRHSERRIKESFLLNINDRLSQKRFINRGLKTFLHQNQLDRLNQSEIIILYDDSIQSSSCSNSTIQHQISPVIQCVFDQIKNYDSEKMIYILGSSFEDFYQHHPTYCHISLSNDHHHDDASPSPTLNIDSYQMSEVLPGLYLGNARDAKDINLLQQNGIKSIINISTTIPCYHENENLFDYLQLPCNDSSQENILQYFENTFDYIQKKLSANENVLVHCQSGISRSPSFVIGYLMKYHSKTFDQAYLLVKEKRKIINPNLNFLTQLTRYEQMMQ